eukprot:ctg_2089.g558
MANAERIDFETAARGAESGRRRPWRRSGLRKTMRLLCLAALVIVIGAALSHGGWPAALVRAAVSSDGYANAPPLVSQMVDAYESGQRPFVPEPPLVSDTGLDYDAPKSAVRNTGAGSIIVSNSFVNLDKMSLEQLRAEYRRLDAENHDLNVLLGRVSRERDMLMQLHGNLRDRVQQLTQEHQQCRYRGLGLVSPPVGATARSEPPTRPRPGAGEPALSRPGAALSQAFRGAAAPRRGPEFHRVVAEQRLRHAGDEENDCRRLAASAGGNPPTAERSRGMDGGVDAAGGRALLHRLCRAIHVRLAGGAGGIVRPVLVAQPALADGVAVDHRGQPVFRGVHRLPPGVPVVEPHRPVADDANRQSGQFPVCAVSVGAHVSAAVGAAAAAVASAGVGGRDRRVVATALVGHGDGGHSGMAAGVAVGGGRGAGDRLLSALLEPVDAGCTGGRIVETVRTVGVAVRLSGGDAPARGAAAARRSRLGLERKWWWWWWWWLASDCARRRGGGRVGGAQQPTRRRRVSRRSVDDHGGESGGRRAAQ